MTQAITESFCERCGTRYEFKAPTRLNAMRKTRGLVSGLRNYIMSQDALGDSIDDGIRTEEEALAAHQLDAFHQSFNFCIDCRQYTCISCWNDDAGRCRSCAPIAGADDLMQRLEAATAQDATQAAALAEATVELGPESWPSSDLVMAEANGNGATWQEELLEPVAGIPDELPAVEIAPEPEPEPLVAEVEPEPQPFTYAPGGGGCTSGLRLRARGHPSPFAAWEEPTVVGGELPEPEPIAATSEPPVHVLAWDDDAAAVEAEPEPEPEPEPSPPRLRARAGARRRRGCA